MLQDEAAVVERDESRQTDRKKWVSEEQQFDATSEATNWRVSVCLVYCVNDVQLRFTPTIVSAPGWSLNRANRAVGFEDKVREFSSKSCCGCCSFRRSCRFTQKTGRQCALAVKISSEQTTAKWQSDVFVFVLFNRKWFQSNHRKFITTITTHPRIEEVHKQNQRIAKTAAKSVTSERHKVLKKTGAHWLVTETQRRGLTGRRVVLVTFFSGRVKLTCQRVLNETKAERKMSPVKESGTINGVNRWRGAPKNKWPKIIRNRFVENRRKLQAKENTQKSCSSICYKWRLSRQVVS